MTCLARLGMEAYLVGKVGRDHWGELILQQLAKEHVHTDFILSKEGVSSPFTYIIVDQKNKTRTCIHTALSEELEVFNASSIC